MWCGVKFAIVIIVSLFHATYMGGFFVFLSSVKFFVLSALFCGDDGRNEMDVLST